MEVIHTSENTVYGVRPDLTLAYVNLGWTRFAALNGGEPHISSEWNLGRCIEDAIAPVLRPFFSDNFSKCLRERRPWEHFYECSSAELYRKFCMKTFPLGKSEGLLIVHSLVREIPQTGLAHEPLEENYRHPTGLIIQCCHCRRVRRTDPSGIGSRRGSPHPSRTQATDFATFALVSIIHLKTTFPHSFQKHFERLNRAIGLGIRWINRIGTIQCRWTVSTAFHRMRRFFRRERSQLGSYQEIRSG